MLDPDWCTEALSPAHFNQESRAWKKAIHTQKNWKPIKTQQWIHDERLILVLVLVLVLSVIYQYLDSAVSEVQWFVWFVSQWWREEGWWWWWGGGRASGLGDPGAEGRDSGVDSRSLRTSTANPKRGHTCQEPIRSHLLKPEQLWIWLFHNL